MKLYLCLLALFSGTIGIVAAFRPSSWIVAEGFCGLLCRYGKPLHRLSPGRHRLWGSGYSVTFIDLRPQKMEIATANCLSADEFFINATAVLSYQIINAETATYEVNNYFERLSTAAQAAVRSVVSLSTADELTSYPWEIGRQLVAHIELEADRLGIVVHALQITSLEATAPHSPVEQAA